MCVVYKEFQKPLEFEHNKNNNNKKKMKKKKMMNKQYNIYVDKRML